MRLYYQDPAFFTLSCDTCEKYVHKDGQLKLLGDGKPWPRPKGTVTPCHCCPKIPRSAPRKTREFAEEISDRNYRAFKHHLRCKAVNRWPADAIVERNAEIIEGVLESVRDGKQEQLIQTLMMVAGMGRGR